ncbi:MAG: hypothetical protein M1820_000480 [Bogoriella megaspora]|nr:MAG: hypothetical protein M1820_000480 [Bogoriella megaspora]
MFSPAAIRENRDVLCKCVDRMVDRLLMERDEKGKVDLLNLSRCLAVDAVSAHLFGRSYGGVGEKGEELSASQFVNAFVAVGRFFYLPNWAFKWVEWSAEKLYPSKEVDESMAKVDEFVGGLVEGAGMEDNTYQSRMLKAGLSKAETAAQCMDLIFAGTDSSGMNLSTICWNLAQNPDQYAVLRKEVLEAKAKDPNVDTQTLPYLRAVVREGLRVSMANPTRLPRIVPPSGWTFQGTYIPSRTIISCQIYTLHFNASTFPNPFSFAPERWLDSDSRVSADMQRDHIPFGIGTRQCIARNLAMAELSMAVQKFAEADALRGANVVGNNIERLDWFNSKVEGEKVELTWLSS